jgi:hypothetical protein
MRKGKGHGRFENQASETGQFGGIVKGTVYPELMSRIITDFRK